MEVKKLTRVFHYNGMELPDPDPSRSPAQVKDFYSAMYAELTTAEIEGPNESKGLLKYTFKKSTGTKGALAAMTTPKAKKPVPFVERLTAIAAGQPDPWSEEGTTLIPQTMASAKLASDFRRLLTLPGEPLIIPSSAISLML